MFYSCLVGASIIMVVSLGVGLGRRDTLKHCNDSAHLGKLDNSDLPCGDAFETIELSNEWGV